MFSSKLSILKRSIFQVEIFQFLNKKDGLIAIFFITIYLAYFYFLMNFWYSPSMKNSYFPISYPRLYAVLGITLHQIPIVILLFIILKKSKQTLSSIGFRKKGLKSSLLIGAFLLFIYVYKYEKINGFQLEMFYFLYYYLINIGFEEEIIFRGYLWPRLVVLLGKFWGTFLTCACFGIAHSFMPIILGDTSQGIGDWVGAGLAGHLLYAFIYTRNNNLLLPIFIHAFLDMPYK